MNNKTKIAIAAGVGLAGFLIYSNWDKILSALKGKDDETGTGAGESASTEPGKNGEPSEYDSLVRKLQAFLGVGVDGKPGKQTNWKLDGYFYDGVNVKTYATAQEAAAAGYGNLKRNGKGVVSPDNVKWYIDTLEARKAPSQIRWKATSDYDLRKKKGEELWNLGKSGYYIVAKFEHTLPYRYYDAGAKNYPVNSAYGTKHFAALAGDSLYNFFDVVGYSSDGSWILRLKSQPNKFLTVNPYNFAAIK